MAREAWTVGRLDDLNRRVDEGFSEMRGEFRSVRSEVREELQGMRAEMNALNRTIVQFAGAVVGTIFLSSMGMIAALIAVV